MSSLVRNVLKSNGGRGQRTLLIPYTRYFPPFRGDTLPPPNPPSQIKSSATRQFFITEAALQLGQLAPALI